MPDVNKSNESQAFRSAVIDALDAADIGAAELARRLGVTRQQVHKWTKADDGPVPSPRIVFAMEDALGCLDQLSGVLGYVRPGKCDVPRAVRMDPDLVAKDRATLLRLYEMMVSQAEG